MKKEVGNSWFWACGKLLEGKRVWWRHWNPESWIAMDNAGYVSRFSNIVGREMMMGFFVLDTKKMTENGWSLWVKPPEVKRNEILFREFDLED